MACIMVHAADCKYAARRRDDAERVARAYGECVRKAYSTIAVDTMNTRLPLAVLPFAAAVAVLRMVTLSL